MPIQDKFPVFRKMYAFTIIIHREIHNMPREYRYTLGAESIRISWECLDLIIGALGTEKSSKANKIKNLSERFDCLNLRIRAMQELKIISVGQFAHWQENYLSDIGGQIGGWRKWVC